MNICPVCRNVNQRDATLCRYCGTALTPPPPEDAVQPVARRRRRWPWVTGGLALLLVVGLTGAAFLGGGGAPQTAALQVGTDPGAALQFVPNSIEAPPNTPVNLTFVNQATVPHNLAFAPETGITAATSVNVPAGAQETISFQTPAPGTYQFVCTIHPGMEGQLSVQ